MFIEDCMILCRPDGVVQFIEAMQESGLRYIYCSERLESGVVVEAGVFYLVRDHHYTNLNTITKASRDLYSGVSFCRSHGDPPPS